VQTRKWIKTACSAPKELSRETVTENENIDNITY